MRLKVGVLDTDVETDGFPQSYMEGAAVPEEAHMTPDAEVVVAAVGFPFQAWQMVVGVKEWTHNRFPCFVLAPRRCSYS